MTNLKVKREHFLPQQMTVIVTGASSGIGYAQVKAFLKAGHQVLAVDKVPYPDKLSETDCLIFIKKDLTDEAHVKEVFEVLDQKYGQLQVLCNTAGMLDNYQTIEQTSFSQWQQILANNLTSQFLMAKYALPYLLKNPTSRIINMASIASLTAGGGGVAYTAAKHAIAGLTKQLAYDYAERGLRVNAIAPGAIQTPMNANDFIGEEPMANWVAVQTPVKRWAQPEEVAELTLFLASDAADYMQGVVIPLDGGWLIR